MTQLPSISPMPLHRQREPFNRPGWVFELKHDGFRGLLYLENGSCRIVTGTRSAEVLRESLRGSFG